MKLSTDCLEASHHPDQLSLFIRGHDIHGMAFPVGRARQDLPGLQQIRLSGCKYFIAINLDGPLRLQTLSCGNFSCQESATELLHAVLRNLQ